MDVFGAISSAFLLSLDLIARLPPHLWQKPEALTRGQAGARLGLNPGPIPKRAFYRLHTFQV